jgi:hypothetical protein
MPEAGQEETVRVVALDRSFHIACYKCEVSCASGECWEERHEDVKITSNGCLFQMLKIYRDKIAEHKLITTVYEYSQLSG